ncbi:hypothetical protein QE152_g5910 [Popillia japonica]|uniref:Uncharacterized protein n=1 Tax=Popillia japonica TaxID=7064 RepID=A0AAW1MLV1_POPJA
MRPLNPGSLFTIHSTIVSRTYAEVLHSITIFSVNCSDSSRYCEEGISRKNCYSASISFCCNLTPVYTTKHKSVKKIFRFV